MRTLRYYFEKELIPGSELAARQRSACVRWRALGAHRDLARPRPDDEGRREPARAQARATVLLALCGERAAGVDSPPVRCSPQTFSKARKRRAFSLPPRSGQLDSRAVSRWFLIPGLLLPSVVAVLTYLDPLGGHILIVCAAVRVRQAVQSRSARSATRGAALRSRRTRRLSLDTIRQSFWRVCHESQAC